MHHSPQQLQIQVHKHYKRQWKDIYSYYYYLGIFLILFHRPLKFRLKLQKYCWLAISLQDKIYIKVIYIDFTIKEILPDFLHATQTATFSVAES